MKFGKRDVSCNMCQKRFNSPQALNAHKKIHVVIDVQKEAETSAQCNICMKTISRARNLKNHMLTHSVKVDYGDSFFIMEKTK